MAIIREPSFERACDVRRECGSKAELKEGSDVARDVLSTDLVRAIGPKLLKAHDRKPHRELHHVHNAERKLDRGPHVGVEAALDVAEVLQALDNHQGAVHGEHQVDLRQSVAADAT